MLAVKTTCKDRWRQVLNEANRVDRIHLFTLQEGVSPHQFAEMKDANVKLVVPKPLHTKYPDEVRDKLMTLNDFIVETKDIR
ncbi:Type-2 restriction enzyme EcoRII [compost metagenome]